MIRPLFSLTNIAKTYVVKEGPVLQVSSVEINRGEIVALVGFSGSGKTTLLNLLALLETPDLSWPGKDPAAPSMRFCPCSDSEPEDVLGVSDVRRQEIRSTFGFVFQQGYLLENLSCGENITVPFQVRKLESKGADVKGMMGMVGLDGAMSSRPPSDLSGGERQRVSVLRALGHGPSVVFADEPTSSLDESNAAVVLSGLRAWCKEEPNRTVLLVTHNIGHAAAYADTLIFMASGRMHEPMKVVSPSGDRMTAAQISGVLTEFTDKESERSAEGAAKSSGLVIAKPSPARHPGRNLRRFVRTFAVSDVFPRVSGGSEGSLRRRILRKGLFQGLTRRRNAQFHSMASMFFAMVLALFFASLYSALADQFRSLIGDQRVANVEVLGRRDGERLLSPKDVQDLSTLAWASGPGFDGIATPQEIKDRQLRLIRPAVESAAGYRVRELRCVRKTENMDFGFTSETNLTTVTTRDTDPVLKRIEVFGGKSMSSLTPTSATVESVFRNSPDAKAGLICTKAVLAQLGFKNEVPQSLSIFPPFAGGGPIQMPVSAVVEWLPKSADVLITDEQFSKFFYDGGGGNPLPRFESVDLYFDDMMRDGIGLYEALQRLGYSVSADKLGLLRWVVSLIRAIRYFSLAAAGGVFLVVLVTLVVSYSEAIRRKEKQIGVLLAYGTPTTLLYVMFLAEVVLVWLVAVVFALPSHWFIARSVENLVSQGFQVRFSQQAAPVSYPWKLWGAILTASLLVAVGSVLWTIWQRIDPKKVAEILRSPD